MSGQSPYTYFYGLLSAVTCSLTMAVCTLKSIESIFDAPCPSVLVQTGCNNDFAGPVCRKDPASATATVPTTGVGKITNVGGAGNASLTVDFSSAVGGNGPIPNGFPAGHFSQGRIRLTEMEPPGGGSRVPTFSPYRYVIYHVGGAIGSQGLDIQVPFYELLDFQAANMRLPDNRISVIAGCDKAAGTCIAKHDNIKHFVAWPYSPNHDVISQGV